MLFSISDRVGHIRSDFTDEELAQLNDTQREALAHVIKAARKAEVAEQDDVAADAAIVEASTALTLAEKKLRDTMPKTSHIDEVRRIAENGRRAALGLGPLPPTKFKPNAKLAAAVTEAEAALVSARQRKAQTQVELRAHRAMLADTVNAWQSHLPPVSSEMVIRDHLARQQEYFRKIAEGEIETREEVEHTMSHLDRSLGSGCALGPGAANFGYGRKHSKRGTRVKLPSQR